MIVDIQNLNTVSQTHPVAPPYLKAKFLLEDMFKMVTDICEKDIIASPWTRTAAS